MIGGSVAAEIALLAIGLYLFLAMKRFYKQGWVWTAVKFALVSFVYGAFFLAPALVRNPDSPVFSISECSKPFGRENRALTARPG